MPGRLEPAPAPSATNNSRLRAGRPHRHGSGALWLLGLVAAAGASWRCATSTWTPRRAVGGHVPRRAARPRTRGPERWPGWPAVGVSVLVGAGAVATQWPALLAGAAVGTGVLAACLAILGTTPAPSFGRAILEVLLAEVVATAGALGVAGFRVDMDADRFSYTVLGLSMAAAVALVYRLGGGLHGLGRSGVAARGTALVLLVVGLAYTAALTRWGSPELRLDVDSAKDWMRDHLGAVPHPIEALLGVPALAWGVTMRDRRRQGWWVCAFGATATATAATRLVGDDVRLTSPSQRRTASWWGCPRVRRHPRGAPGPGKAGPSSRPGRPRRPPPRAPAPPAAALARPHYTRPRSPGTWRGAGVADRNRLESGRWQ